MPKYYSHKGVWHPSKEHVVLPHLQGTEKEVYDGPDRAAEYELFQEGVKTFGIDFEKDPDIIWRSKQFGYSSVMEYALAMGYDPVKAEADFKKNASEITKHELPKRKETINAVGGGVDTTGQGQDVIGGFGDEHLRPVK